MENRKTGTTTVGLICEGAVILAADRKATMGYLVANKDALKILSLDEHIVMTIAGLEGDGQALKRYISAEFKLFKLKEGRRINVGAGASLVANILYSRRYYPYYVQLIVGGYDSEPKLFSLDAAGAVSDEKEYFSTGSGSPFALGVLEDGYKKGMTVESGKKLAARAVHAATKRDIASGGSGIDVVVVDASGMKRLTDSQVAKLLE
ncbi:MAG: proteasome subunit beta [Nanoarchaeota archaeon]|nr:proteasome subunit beta [Nanoarchaeota archaeon]